MGLQIFENSGTFSPSAHGLAVGDTVDLILVGGGSSGSAVIGSSSSTSVSPSVAGGASTFGTLASSADGYTMGKGGPAIVDSSNRQNSRCGCGGGGYLPGLPVYGGNGSGKDNLAAVGLAGTYQGSASPYANPYGDGNKGATGFAGIYDNTHASGGNGYGAGGSGSSTASSSPAADGGDSGKIRFASIQLASTANVAVTVGSGGVNAGNNANKGANGVVLVFW